MVQAVEKARIKWEYVRPPVDADDVFVAVRLRWLDSLVAGAIGDFSCWQAGFWMSGWILHGGISGLSFKCLNKLSNQDFIKGLSISARHIEWYRSSKQANEKWNSIQTASLSTHLYHESTASPKVRT